MRIKNISKQDAIILLELINESLACVSEEQVLQVMGKLDALLPYQAAISCITHLGTNGAIEEMKIINVSYPAEYLTDLAGKELIMKDLVVIENFKNFRLQYWADTLNQQPLTRDMHAIASLAEDYGFSKVRAGWGYCHGVRNFKQTEGSFFCYHGLRRSSRTEAVLSLVIPHFHEALRRVTGISKAISSPMALDTGVRKPFRADSLPKNGSSLTPKEVEVLKWIKQGKSTWDTSTILGISERTVKFHVGNIMQKLDATTRTHAVALALEQGLVDME